MQTPPRGTIIDHAGDHWLVLGQDQGDIYAVRAKLIPVEDSEVVMKANIVSSQLAAHVNDIIGAMPIRLIEHCTDTETIDAMTAARGNVQKFNDEMIARRDARDAREAKW